jgi:electron transfer flavoprotein alpha subunit
MKKPSAAMNAAAIQPARLLPKSVRRKPVGQAHRLQSEEQRNEAPAQGIVAEEQHAHGNQHLAEGRVIVVVGNGTARSCARS